MNIHFHPLAFVALSLLASAPLLPASDLSRYREFHLGMALTDVSKQAGMEASEARLISSRPQRIEELDWRTGPSVAAAAQPDSVREIRFRFYAGSLFEMTVTYDSDRTNGLTDTDMTDALSAIYGPASTPVAKELPFNAGYNTTARVIAHWDDSQNLVSLVGFSYGHGFGVVVCRRSLPPSNSALVAGDRRKPEWLDCRVGERPQKVLDLEGTKLDAEAKAKDEKSRLENKTRKAPMTVPFTNHLPESGMAFSWNAARGCWPF